MIDRPLLILIAFIIVYVLAVPKIAMWWITNYEPQTLTQKVSSYDGN